MTTDLEMQEFVEFLDHRFHKSMINSGWKGSSRITKTQGRGNTYSLKLTYCYETTSAKLTQDGFEVRCSTFEKAKSKQNLFNQLFNQSVAA